MTRARLSPSSILTCGVFAALVITGALVVLPPPWLYIGTAAWVLLLVLCIVATEGHLPWDR